MKMFRNFLILSSLLVVGYGISCYTCEKNFIDNVPGVFVQPDCTEENKKECYEAIDYCVSINYERKHGEREHVMEYSKDCGVQSGVTKSCEALKDKMKDNTDIVWSKCNIVSCTEDLCNSQTAEEVKMMGAGDDKNDENEESYVSSGRSVAVNIVLMTAAYFYF